MGTSDRQIVSWLAGEPLYGVWVGESIVMTETTPQPVKAWLCAGVSWATNQNTLNEMYATEILYYADRK